MNDKKGHSTRILRNHSENVLAYRVRSAYLDSDVKVVEGKVFGAHPMLGLGNLVEESS